MPTISDSFGESLERAGYERVNDSLGGWREDNSNGDYRSTRDRMNDHLARYGSGWETTRQSQISGAASKVRDSLSSTKQNTLTNNALAQVINPKRSIKGPYNPNIDPSYTPNLLNKYAPENFAHVREIAAHDWIEDTKRSQSLNAVGRLGSRNVAEIAKEAVKNPTVGGVVGMAVGLATSKIGDIANAVTGQANREDLSKFQQSIYDSYYADFTKQKEAHRSDIGDKIVDTLGFVGDVITKNPFGTMRYFANTYNEKDAFLDTLKGNPEVAAFSAELDRQKNAKIRPTLGGGGDKGILNTMYLHLKKNDESEAINKIPALRNYWNNVTIK